jgi:hypothetical protein
MSCTDGRLIFLINQVVLVFLVVSCLPQLLREDYGEKVKGHRCSDLTVHLHSG